MKRLILIGLMLAATTISAAEVGDKKFSLGPRATYFRGNDADDGNWYGGAQFRYYPLEALGLEGSIDYRRESFDGTKVHIYPVQASLLATVFRQDPVSIFLLAGGGWYFTRVDPPSGNDETDNRFGFHAGLGGELMMNEFWSLDATYRYVWLEEFQSRDAALLDKNYDDSGNMVTIGLNYHF
jgi:opacity protein-like surface antigen